jgi:hypothetical protein
MTRTALLASTLALAIATGVYLLKDRVQRSENELRVVRADIQVELGRIDRLRTEWAVANQPARLAGLATSHLDLQPLDPTRVVAVDDLPYRIELMLVGQSWPARLPSGADVALRLKPRLEPALWSLATGMEGVAR